MKAPTPHDAIAQHGSDVVVQVLVTTRSARDRVGPLSGDRLKISLTAPPVDGQANRALVRLLADICGVSQRQVTLAGGQHSRRKTVRISGAQSETLRAAVASMSK